MELLSIRALASRYPPSSLTHTVESDAVPSAPQSPMPIEAKRNVCMLDSLVRFEACSPRQPAGLRRRQKFSPVKGRAAKGRFAGTAGKIRP